MVVTHVDYTRHTSAPGILVIAKNFADSDAKDIIEAFHALGCQIVKRVFCYEGKTTPSSLEMENRMSRYARTPNPGSSISVIDGRESFSLGLYVKFHNDPEVHELTIYHGVS